MGKAWVVTGPIGSGKSAGTIAICFVLGRLGLSVINAEIWARDPANPDGFMLSDGLEFTVCP